MIGVTQLLSKPLFPIGVGETDPFGDGSLKSFYRFDNSLNDESGNNYNATKESTPTFQTFNKVGTHSIGPVGRVTTGQVTLPNNFSNNETFTCWVYSDAFYDTDKTWRVFEMHISTYEFLALTFTKVGSTQTMFAYIRTGTGSYRYASTTAFTFSNEWIFFTYRYNNSTGTHYVSRNGGTETEMTTTATSGGAPSVPSTTDMILGQNYINGSTVVDNNRLYIDHIRHFNRALTQSEITQLYNEHA